MGQGGDRLRSARTEENAKLLLQKFPQSASDFVLPIVRRSDREHLFARKENSRRPTTRCRGCALSSRNVHFHTQDRPHGTDYNLKICAPWQTQLSFENS